MFIQMLAEVAVANNPWWMTAITGSGGALVVLFLWNRNLNEQLKQEKEENKKNTEQLAKVTRESIECIAKITEKHSQDTVWKNKLESMIQSVESAIK